MVGLEAGEGGAAVRKHSELMAHMLALILSGWGILTRMAASSKHGDSITTRPLSQHGVARRTAHRILSQRVYCCVPLRRSSRLRYPHIDHQSIPVLGNHMSHEGQLRLGALRLLEQSGFWIGQ